MDDIEPAPLSPLAGVLIKGAPGDLPDVRSGVVGVQDEGSQLVALALTRAAIEGSETAWLDMCAGPGGKAAILEGIALERGAQLTAVEQHSHRADLVAHSLHSSRSHVITGDASTRPWGEQLFDRVLVDVPCTGLGALRRRPESRWRRSPEDLAALAPIQRQLLNAAIDATRSGGVIGYVTCSPHLAETEFVVSDVLRKRTDVTQEDARTLLPEVSDCGEGLAVQLWPHRHGTDAMFLAVLRKK
jgi:16S rRNA (cytosine967-C5)-methyltransferase